MSKSSPHSLESPGTRLARKAAAFPKALHFKIKEGEAAYRQITEHLRGLILSKALPTGTRLPTIQALAAAWGTNYFTAQNGLIPLINEGLLHSRPGRGTFVAENTRQLRTVAVYGGADFWTPSRGLLFQQLYLALGRAFLAKEITMRLFMDPRPLAEQNTPFKPLLKAVEEHSVQAVISMALDIGRQGWVERIPAPHASLSPLGKSHCVAFDVEQFLDIGMGRLAARGCRTVGFLCGGLVWDGRGSEIVEVVARRHGLRLSTSWNRATMEGPCHYEAFGHAQFKEIWHGPNRPDGIYAYPDSIGRGVLAAVLSEGVRVPEELHLLLHRNESVEFFSPVPVDWLQLSLPEVAQALVENASRQFAGEPHEAVNVRASLSPMDTPPG